MSNIWLDPFGLKLLKQSREEEDTPEIEENTSQPQCPPGYTYNYYGYSAHYTPYYVYQYPQPVQCYPQAAWPYQQYGHPCYTNPPQAPSGCHCHTQNTGPSNTIASPAPEEEEKVERKIVPTIWNPRTGTRSIFKR